ncbi:MFS transporter [Bacillus sp. GZT]|uniref:MFS transporter n=1 Tax=Bacillus TaxID=1386 RepID=UPI0007A03BAE|nr:MFS transporter [Bacillus sp. GZT]KYZ67873.1 hypothetical protein A3782_18940 [Bacillus sp. GZT]MCU5324711.1 MFS transporter [Bacillus cereus]MCU5718113.1 MFS transporter [Bacillus cereus]
MASRNLDVQTKENSGIIILIALAMGFIMATLDVTVVNVAVVNIQETLGLTLYSSTWIVDGYILSFAALLLFAKMVSKFSSKSLLFIALFIASIGSLLLMLLVNNVSYIGIAIIYSVVNLGIGIAVPAMTTIVMKSAGRENGNMAGVTLNVNRQIGALVGIAIMGIILNESSNWYKGASYSFLVIGLSYLCAVFLVWKFVGRE